MDVRVLPDAGALAIEAADIVEQTLLAERPVIGLAAGATPLATYAELVHRHRTLGLRLDHATYVLLDEYVGLPDGHPASFLGVVRRVLTDPAGVPALRVHAPDHPARYERLLAELGPRSIQLLGIGRNGHIGFNEPGTSPESRTHVAELHDLTRADAAPAFAPDHVPTHAVTMGIASILDAERILLLATGTPKAEAVASALEREPHDACPASALRRHHDVTVLLDPAAASHLSG